MSIKLLPAAVNPGDPSQAPGASTDVSTSLVPLAQRAITTRAGQTSLVPSADTFTWSSSSRSSSSWSSSSSSSGARRGEAPFIDATPVEDSPSHETTDETGSGWEYISDWARSGLAAGTAIAQYLLYAATGASWSGQLVNLYA